MFGDYSNRNLALGIAAVMMIVGAGIWALTRSGDAGTAQDGALSPNERSFTAQALDDAGQPEQADQDNTTLTTEIGAATTTTTTATADAGSEATGDTVEARVGSPESDPDEQAEDLGPDETVPTAPIPTEGTCRIAIGDLAGQAGVIDVGNAGSCTAIGVTAQAVDPGDDLSSTDWRQLEICQRHPAAVDIDVVVRTSSGSVDLTNGMSRSSAEADSDPVESITVTFSNQDAPASAPRPIAVCRTSTAELSIVHQPLN